MSQTNKNTKHINLKGCLSHFYCYQDSTQKLRKTKTFSFCKQLRKNWLKHILQSIKAFEKNNQILSQKFIDEIHK